MDPKGFPGSHELVRIKVMVDDIYGSSPMNQQVYQRMCNDLDSIANRGNQQTKYAVVELKEYIGQHTQGGAPQPAQSHLARTEIRSPTPTHYDRLYAATQINEHGYCDPKKVRQPQERGRDASVSVDGNIYYLQGGIRAGWSGEFKVIGGTSRSTAFVARAVYGTETVQTQKTQEPAAQRTQEQARATVPRPEDTAKPPIPVKQEPAKPQYLDEMVQATSELTKYSNLLATSIKNLTDTTIEDANLATVIAGGDKTWQAEKTKHAQHMGLLDRLDGAYVSLPAQKEYTTIRTTITEQEDKLGGLLIILYQRLADLDKQQEQAGYQTKLSDTTPKTQATLYGVQVNVGRRTVNIVFPEDSLPKTEADFQAYLKDPSNFPERQDREVIDEFLRLVFSGASVVYTGGRVPSGSPFTKAFRDGKTIVSTEQGEPVEKKIKRTEVHVTQGGGVG